MRHVERIHRLAALAQRQGGPFSLEQALSLGFSSSALSRLVVDRVVRRVHPRVYVFGHGALRLEASWRAAWLACGEESVLTSVTAGAVHRLVRRPPGAPHVILAGSRGRQIDGVAAHRYPIADDEWSRWRGMRVARPMRAVVDMAEDLRERELTEAVEQSMLREVFDVRALAASMDRVRGRPGLRGLDRVLAKIGDEPPGFESRNERRAAELLAAAGLSPSGIAVPILVGPGRWRRADLFFADIDLDLEIDGPWHLLPHRRRDDVVRDAELRRVGIEVERQPEELVWQQPAVFVAAVRERVERMRRRLGDCVPDVRDAHAKPVRPHLASAASAMDLPFKS